jgi:hypothetical protein
MPPQALLVAWGPVHKQAVDAALARLQPQVNIKQNQAKSKATLAPHPPPFRRNSEPDAAAEVVAPAIESHIKPQPPPGSKMRVSELHAQRAHMFAKRHSFTRALQGNPKEHVRAQPPHRHTAAASADDSDTTSRDNASAHAAPRKRSPRIKSQQQQQQQEQQRPRASSTSPTIRHPVAPSSSRPHPPSSPLSRRGAAPRATSHNDNR